MSLDSGVLMSRINRRKFFGMAAGAAAMAAGVKADPDTIKVTFGAPIHIDNLSPGWHIVQHPTITFYGVAVPPDLKDVYA